MVCGKNEVQVEIQRRPVDVRDSHRRHKTFQYIGFDFENDSITHARTVVHLPDERKWDPIEIEKLWTTPSELHATA